MHSSLYIGNSSVVTVSDLRSATTGDLVTGATVQATGLTTARGASVSGITLPLALSEVSAGQYRGSIPATVDIKANRLYLLTVTAESAGVTGQWVETLVAQTRSA